METTYTILEYSILESLLNKNIRSKATAITQSDIQKLVLNEKGEQYCDRTIYNNIRKNVKNGYLNEGLNYGNAKTFYLSQAGWQFMKDVKTNCEDSQEESNDEIEPEETMKNPMEYEYFINSMDYARHHFESVEALLKYKNDDMIELNKERLLSSINLVMDSLQELKENL